MFCRAKWTSQGAKWLALLQAKRQAGRSACDLAWAARLCAVEFLCLGILMTVKFACSELQRKSAISGLVQNCRKFRTTGSCLWRFVASSLESVKYCTWLICKVFADASGRACVSACNGFSAESVTAWMKTLLSVECCAPWIKIPRPACLGLDLFVSGVIAAST